MTHRASDLGTRLGNNSVTATGLGQFRKSMVVMTMGCLPVELAFGSVTFYYNSCFIDINYQSNSNQLFKRLMMNEHRNKSSFVGFPSPICCRFINTTMRVRNNKLPDIPQTNMTSRRLSTRSLHRCHLATRFILSHWDLAYVRMCREHETF